MLTAGAERLKTWHGRELDASALWGLHTSACSELAEAAAECVAALDKFGTELSGSAAAKAGAHPAADTFNTIADYLKSQVRDTPFCSRSAPIGCAPLSLPSRSCLPCGLLLQNTSVATCHTRLYGKPRNWRACINLSRRMYARPIVQARAMVVALSLLADAYQAIADKAAAEALAAFEADQRSASSKEEGACLSYARGLYPA